VQTVEVRDISTWNLCGGVKEGDQKKHGVRNTVSFSLHFSEKNIVVRISKGFDLARILEM
jgi:hypothetical protein